MKVLLFWCDIVCIGLQFIDVGQDDSIVVISDGFLFLFDMGRDMIECVVDKNNGIMW